MDIIISNASDKPIYEQIASQIKSMIMSGELKQGDPLPSMRVLAKELRISVITTKRAYEELERAGFIDSVEGRGSFVKQCDIRLVREHNLREVEGYISSACDVARSGGIGLDELLEMVKLIYNEQ